MYAEQFNAELNTLLNIRFQELVVPPSSIDSQVTSQSPLGNPTAEERSDTGITPQPANLVVILEVWGLAP